MPLPLQQVRAIHPGRLGADQHLPGLGAGDGPGGDPEHFRAARLCYFDRTHGRWRGGHLDQGV